MALPRPSTAGGLSTKDSTYVAPQRGASHFDKRMSKDDMFFGTAGRNHKNNFTGDQRMSRDDMYIKSRMATMSQFHIPVRGSAITPQHSPDYPVLHEVSIPVRMQTPESMTSGEIPIGMALGSPAHIPSEPSRWQAQFPPASTRAASPQIASPRTITTQINVMTAEPSPVTTVPPPGGSLQRKKTGRRKLFGLFGGRKHADDEAGTKDSTSSLLNEKLETSQTPTRSNTQRERKAPKHKPAMSRSNTVPYALQGDGAAPMVSSGPLNLQGPLSRQANNFLRPEVSRMPPTQTFLDVQIPDTKLERYSVMFSDVLNPGGAKPEPAVSLLARRQATLEKLKSINDRIEAEEAAKDAMRPRRATSPQPQPSPRLSVFPTPPSGRTQPVMSPPTAMSRAARSNTSPGRLPSPTQPSFDRRRPPLASISTKNLTVPNPFDMHPPSSRSDGPIYPADTSFHFGNAVEQSESGFVVIDSPIEMEPEDHEIVIAQPLKPTLHEPQWQMVSPSTSSMMSSGAFSSHHVRSPSTSSSSTHVTKPSTDSKFEEQDAAFQNAVEVSIARQISISRQQRSLLRPLQTRRRTESGSGTSPKTVGPSPRSVDGRSPLGVTVIKAPSPTNHMSNGESLRAIHSSTPTLVHPRNSPVNPEQRKSSYVMVEESD